MSSKHIVTAVLLMVAAPLHAQSVSAGIEAWQQSDYTKAVAIWMPLATKGDADAQFNLGQAYRLGRGVPTNVAAAKTWFERAAAQGHVDAQTTLGLLLFQNGDQIGGLKWLKKASDQGEARAMLVYGTALVNGDGVPQDPILGYALVSGAASQGLAPAKQTLDQLDQMMPAADRKRALAMALGRPKPAAPSTNAKEAPLKTEKLASATSTPKPSPKTAKKKVAASITPAEDTPAQSAPQPEQVASADPSPPPPNAEEKPVQKPTRHAEAEKKAAEPKSAAVPSGAWRIQLGAFAQKSNAEAMYKKLSGKDALDGRRPFYVAAGAVTRLQVGPFESKGAASTACKAIGVACFPVIAN